MANNNWDEGLANMEALAARFKDIERTALRAVVDVIKPRLAGAAPIKVSAEQGGSSLPEGTLKASVRGRVHIATGDDDPSTAVVDFGKYSHVAGWVDVGHRPPHARALSRAGHTVSTTKNTPAHPFVRAVEDSSQAAAQQAYETAMTAEIKGVLNGE